MWLSGVGTVPQTEKSPVQFLVRADAWVVVWSPVGGMGEATDPSSLSHRCFSPSFSFPFPLKGREGGRKERKEEGREGGREPHSSG